MVHRPIGTAVPLGLSIAAASALATARDPEPPPEPNRDVALDQTVQRNPYAFVPPQCYTKTVDAAGKAHNPCHTCHVASRAPNYINDAEVQLAYDFVPA